MDDTPVGRIVYALARYSALAGGVVLVVIASTTVVSVIGRALIPLGLGPIPGDYEIVEAGMAFAIFCFMAWCQLSRGNAVVAIVTDSFSPRVNAIIELVMDSLALIVAVFLVWRHTAGLIDKFGNGETTYSLRFPLWWNYTLGMVGAVVWVIVAFYCVLRSAANATSRNPQMPTSEIAE